MTSRQDPEPIEDKHIDEDDDNDLDDDELETDSGSHNESTEPPSPHRETFPPPVESKVAKEKAALKKFWAKYVVPKNGKVGEAEVAPEDGKDDDAMDSTQDSNDPSPFIDVGDVGSETELNEALAEISGGSIPVVYHKKGRAYTFLPSGYNPPPLQSTSLLWS